MSLPSNNKLIAKNTLFLYVRMFFSMGVSLYTSRIVLATLGVTDYGIWNLVAGVIAMFSFIKASMSGATSRFISFEIGKKEEGNIQSVFSGALTIHIIIAIIVFILGETIGLWFIQNKLAIPEDRLLAANIVYQFVILSTMVHITQVPYNAQILSNERMSIYACFEIMNSVLKLIIIYLLVIIVYDKLVLYGFLSFIVTLGIASAYRYYCIHYIDGCQFRITFKKELLLPMLSFSSWDLYGNMAVMARTHGVNMLLNIFFTAVMNAASGIATQVQGAVMAFSQNVLTAFRPQIVKSYANGDYKRMTFLINKASTYTSLLLLFLILPICAETEYILVLWLKIPPHYAVTFTRYILLFTLIANFSSVLVCGIHATGKIKRTSIINGTLYIMVIPFSYISYKSGYTPEYAYLFNIIAVFAGLMFNVFNLSCYLSAFSKWHYVFNIIIKFAIIGISVYYLTTLVQRVMEESFIRLLVSIFISWSLISLVAILFLLNRGERAFLREKLLYYRKLW